ncbi:CIA30 family protein [Schleiferiaceae bacterium]|nr:CIA30 family protein [Schleiferiaceae bacterium]MDB9928870.1 CIA30 family protein [Schleiferiaceae bacterium]
MNALFLTIAMLTSSITLFDFSAGLNLDRWAVVNDGVMGGLSKGALEITGEGHGRFSGTVSLENYGGFTSIRCAVEDIAVSEDSKIQLRIKGDGKDYQFRVKHKARDYQSYITTFSTTGAWETIEITLNDLYPSWRGQKLDMPNFDRSSINEFTFLIANKRNETFELLIDKVVLVP